MDIQDTLKQFGILNTQFGQCRAEFMQLEYDDPSWDAKLGFLQGMKKDLAEIEALLVDAGLMRRDSCRFHLEYDE